MLSSNQSLFQFKGRESYVSQALLINPVDLIFSLFHYHAIFSRSTCRLEELLTCIEKMLCVTNKLTNSAWMVGVWGGGGGEDNRIPVYLEN